MVVVVATATAITIFEQKATFSSVWMISICSMDVCMWLGKNIEHNFISNSESETERVCMWVSTSLRHIDFI